MFHFLYKSNKNIRCLYYSVAWKKFWQYLIVELNQKTKSFNDLDLIDPLHLIFLSELKEEDKIYRFLDFSFVNQIIWFMGKKTISWKKNVSNYKHFLFETINQYIPFFFEISTNLYYFNDYHLLWLVGLMGSS